MNIKEIILSNQSDIIRGLSWSPDGKYLSVGGYDEILTVWDVEDEDEIFVYNELTGWITRSEWSSDSKYIACSSYQTGEIKILRSDNGEEILSISAHEKGCLCLKWMVNDTILASGGHDYKFKLWDVKSGKEIVKLNCPDQVNSIIEIPNSSNIFVSLPGFETVFFNPFNPETLNRAIVLKARTPIHHQYIVSPDGNFFICLLKWELMVVFDINTGEIVKEFICPNEKWESFSWSPDGKKLAAAGIDIYFYDTKNWDEIIRIKQPVLDDSFFSKIDYCLWTSDSSVIFTSARYTGIINAWDANTGEKIMTWESGESKKDYVIEDMAVHPTKKCIAFGDNKGNVFVLELV